MVPHGATIPWYLHHASMVGGVCALTSSVCSIVLPFDSRGTSHGASMVHAWRIHGDPMVLSWSSRGASMVRPCDFHGVPMVFSMDVSFHGASMIMHASIASMWDLRGAFMDFHGLFTVLPRYFYEGASMASPLCFHGPSWCFHGASMVTSWYLHRMVLPWRFHGSFEKNKQCALLV